MFVSTQRQMLWVYLIRSGLINGTVILEYEHLQITDYCIAIALIVVYVLVIVARNHACEARRLRKFKFQNHIHSLFQISLKQDTFEPCGNCEFLLVLC